ncbi:hypothetical protein LJC23_04905 [Desulfovibrio sp. OttesenSCG-928-I05]|nr:hypothetical protein [Desulfovibrio sp. OttesenSCG-928-I05]
MARCWISWERLKDLVGRRRAAALCRVFGGRAAYVPFEPDRKHRIAVIAGLNAMAAMCAACGGKTVSFPKGTGGGRNRAAITAMLEAGASCSQAAHSAGVSLRYVQRVAQGLRAEASGASSGKVERLRKAGVDGPDDAEKS